MSLTTFIVDDEPIARQLLREELESMEDVVVVGEADNGSVALERLPKLQPDLVLLDLQMPVMGGLDVIRNLTRGVHLPVIVIVTAYDRYAIQAFEAGAIDYLLKPVSHQRLAKAVERAKHITRRRATEKLAQLQEVIEPGAGPRNKKVVGRAGDEFLLLSVDEIFAFQADGDLVWIVTAKQRYAATQTLKVLEERLLKAGFRRIHRNAMVNVNHVRKMSALSSQRWLITLTNDLEFVASKRQARSVRQFLQW